MPCPATHVGSRPRPHAEADLAFARERGTLADAAFDPCMAAAVTENVRHRKEAGIDITSDWECAKISSATSVKDRHSGFSGDSLRDVPADLGLYPSCLDRLARPRRTTKYARPLRTGPVTPPGHDELHYDISNLMDDMAGLGMTRGFVGAICPGVIALFPPIAHYPCHHNDLAVSAHALREEYRTIRDAGLALQSNCPDLALSRPMPFAHLDHDVFVRIAASHLEALEHALAGLPQDQLGLHLSWENYEAPDECEIAMDRAFPLLAHVPARYIPFEAARPRHGHEWCMFRDRRAEFPDDKVPVPNAVDTTTNAVEHPERVRQRLEPSTEFLGREELTGSDCGFGSFAGFGAGDPEIARARPAMRADRAAGL